MRHTSKTEKNNKGENCKSDAKNRSWSMLGYINVLSNKKKTAKINMYNIYIPNDTT